MSNIVFSYIKLILASLIDLSYIVITIVSNMMLQLPCSLFFLFDDIIDPSHLMVQVTI
jgi:hypothetical protein